MITRSLLLVALLSLTAVAQKPVPRLYLAPDLRVESTALGAGGNTSLGTLVVAPDGRMVIAPKNSFGDIRGIDSSGTPMPWRVTTGRGEEIGWTQRFGWAGQSLWVSDIRYQQVVIIDANGKITKSIPYHSWVHPSWKDRHTYPLFGRMEPLAVYADFSMLVIPEGPRSLLDTPGFDRTLTHIVRIDPSGTITRVVARMDPNAGRLTVQGPRRSEHTMFAPFYGRTHWAVSTDGRRLVFATPGSAPADSGSFRVSVLTEEGDTVFSRRYPWPTVPVTKAMRDSALSKIRGFGDMSAERIKALFAPKIPAYRSFVMDVFAGLDRSTWVILKPPADSAKWREALVLDERGEPLAMVRMPDGVTPFAVDRSHLWGIDKGKPSVVRLKLQTALPPAPPAVKAAPPARTEKASIGPARGRPRT